MDYLHSQALCDSLTVFSPTAPQIAELVQRAKQDMPMLATTDVIQSVARINPDCFWAIRRATGSGLTEPSGFVAFLMLSRDGQNALLAGELNVSNPAPEHLVGQHQRPAAIYVWALHARGGLTAALALVMDKLQSPNYRTANFVARAATAEGANFLLALGFTEQREPNGLLFHHFKRQFGPPAPQLSMSGRSSGQEKLVSNRPAVTAVAVRDFSGLLHAVAVRSAVYVGEEQCPFAEEFDGNDFTATQIVGYVGHEPAGSMRIRYFSGFAKFERLAVRREFRGLGLAREMLGYGIELCGLKGYATALVHARCDKVAFWSAFGFNLVQNRSSFVFSDFEYVEMSADLPPSASPITLGIDPYILLRPEGAWDVPGILEASAQRI